MPGLRPSRIQFGWTNAQGVASVSDSIAATWSISTQLAGKPEASGQCHAFVGGGGQGQT